MKTAKFENSIEEKVKDMLVHKDEMLEMIDNGKMINEVYHQFNINNKYQPRFNAAFKEKYGFTIKEYRQHYLQKIRKAGRTTRELKEQKFKNCLAEVIISLMDGESVNDTLYKYKIFSPDRVSFESFVKSVFGYGLLQIKQKPDYLDRGYVRAIADKLKSGEELSDELRDEVQRQLFSQRIGLTPEQRKLQEKKMEIQSEIDEHKRIISDLNAKKTKIENQYKKLADAIEKYTLEIAAEEITLTAKELHYKEIFKDND